jgi:Sigma-70 region 2
VLLIEHLCIETTIRDYEAQPRGKRRRHHGVFLASGSRQTIQAILPVGSGECFVAHGKHPLLSGELGDIRGSLAAADAFDSLFQRSEAQIFGYLWRMTGDRQLASDLSQETFLRAWQRFEKLSAYENPLGWLFRVATNLALDERRGRQRHGWLTDPLDGEGEPAGSDPSESVLDRELILQVLQGAYSKGMGRAGTARSLWHVSRRGGTNSRDYARRR